MGRRSRSATRRSSRCSRRSRRPRSTTRAHRDEQRARADLEVLVETSPVGVVVFDAGTARPLSLNREVRLLNSSVSGNSSSATSPSERMYPRRSSSRSTPGRSRGCSTNGCPWGQPALLWGEAGGDATATVRPFDPAVSAHSQPLVAARPGRGGRWRLTPQRRSRRSPAVERCPGIGSRPARGGCGSEYMQATRTSSYRSFKVHEYYGLVTVRTNQPYQRWGCERAWPGVPGRWRPSGGNPFRTERLSCIDDVRAGCPGSGSALQRSGRVRAACRFSLGCCWASR